MASPITFSGLASGIDSDALIKATSDAAKKQRVEPDQNKITELQGTDSAFDTFKTKLTDLQTKVLEFASLSGGAVVKQAESSNETVATASASNSASDGSYSLTITQLARNATFSFDDRFTDATSVINSSIVGTAPVTVQIGTGTTMETVTVNVNSTTTVSDFVSQFNLNATKGEASMVNVGTASSPSYAIILSSNNEGTENGTIAVTVDPGITGAGSGALTASTISQAQDALFSVSGINGTLTRATNTVTDAITGLALNLRSVGTSTVKISNDSAATTTKVQDFVDSFNDLVAFVAENNQITRQEDGEDVSNTFAPLASTRVDDNALSALRDDIFASSASSGISIKIFAELGITTQRDGTLAFDTDKFKSALSSEPTSVSSILTTFGDRVAVTGGTIDQYVRFNGIVDITLNANKQQITDLNSRIALALAAISRQEDTMRQQFASLEGLVGKMQSQQQALTSALAGLN